MLHLELFATQVSADDFDGQISAKDAVISKSYGWSKTWPKLRFLLFKPKFLLLKIQQAELEAEVNWAESQKAMKKFNHYQAKLLHVMIRLKNRRVVLKNQGLLLVILTRFLNSKSVSSAINRVVAIHWGCFCKWKNVAQQKGVASIEEKTSRKSKSN